MLGPANFRVLKAGRGHAAEIPIRQSWATSISLAGLRETRDRGTDDSIVMNTKFVTMIHLESLIALAVVIIGSEA